MKDEFDGDKEKLQKLFAAQDAEDIERILFSEGTSEASDDVKDDFKTDDSSTESTKGDFDW